MPLAGVGLKTQARAIGRQDGRRPEREEESRVCEFQASRRRHDWSLGARKILGVVVAESWLHPSHALLEHKGLVWCGACGFYATVAEGQKAAPRMITRPCRRRAPTVGSKYFLARFEKGLTPKKAMQEWPADREKQTAGKTTRKERGEQDETWPKSGRKRRRRTREKLPEQEQKGRVLDPVPPTDPVVQLSGWAQCPGERGTGAREQPR